MPCSGRKRAAGPGLGAGAGHDGVAALSGHAADCDRDSRDNVKDVSDMHERLLGLAPYKLRVG